jgi:hypothetical protein
VLVRLTCISQENEKLKAQVALAATTTDVNAFGSPNSARKSSPVRVIFENPRVIAKSMHNYYSQVQSLASIR